jgi:hypothetical protein
MVQLDEESAVTCISQRRALLDSPRTPGGLMQAVKGLFMEKWFCWVSMGVSGFLLLLFLLDLFLDFPFRGLSKTVDVLSMIACGVVLYLAWDALRDLR